MPHCPIKCPYIVALIRQSIVKLRLYPLLIVFITLILGFSLIFPDFIEVNFREKRALKRKFQEVFKLRFFGGERSIINRYHATITLYHIVLIVLYVLIQFGISVAMATKFNLFT